LASADHFQLKPTDQMKSHFFINQRRKMKNKLVLITSLVLVLAFMLSACQTATPAPTTAAPAAVDCKAQTASEAVGSYQVPAPIPGCFNVAFVYVGPHDDGGYSQSHDVGRMYVQDNVKDVHTAYVENVAEGTDSEQVTRSLARKGFNVIFTTSFGFMDSTELVASEFPNISFIHDSGYKFNTTNFGNLFGAMEDIKYMAGMLAGSRAMKDGNPKIGYMATFPIPEELRLGNAFALGVMKTCPECKIDVRFINTWHDPIKEQDAAKSLFDAGAQVVMTGADTPAPAIAAPAGKWGITYDYVGNCTDAKCLTSMYWNWGPLYAKIVEAARAGTYKGGAEYFEGDSGGLGLFGFMKGETYQPGVKDLPEADLKLINDTLAEVLAGKFTRFDVFKGPITDNTGKVILPEGGKIEQIDIDCFVGGAVPCTVGMYWWNQNVIAELPKLGN
jgi:basic membrane protein A